MWHYQIRKRTGTDYHGERWTTYDIVENYGKHGHTMEGMRPFGSTKEELIKTLEMMLADAKHYRTLVEK